MTRQHSSSSLTPPVARKALCVAIILGASGAQLALAQGGEEIYVTGTRVTRTTFDTPNPITVLDNQYMEDLGLVNISDMVQQIPQNQAYVTPTNIGLGNFNVGASLANLRGMNPYYGTRTLTLVDGRRHVPSTNGGAVDLNLIPSLLVARSEIVTGGASAAYGTDAVAGVVNIILDTKFEGVKAQIDYGQTFRSDGDDFHGAFAAGHGFANGRGHFVIGGEYQDSGEIDDCSEARLWCAESWDDITNPGFNNPASPTYGEPNFVIARDSRSDNQTFTGVFQGLGLQFNDAGTDLVDYDPGKYASGSNFLPFQGHSGGDGSSVYDSLKIRVPVERYSLFGHVDYDLTDNIQAFVEGSYGKRSSTNVGWAFGPGVTFIQPDNAFLTPAVQAVITTPQRFNRSLVDKIRQTNDTNNETYRFATGAKGDLTDTWAWDVYYQYGRNEQSQRLHNDKVNSFFAYSVDAVIDPASGQPACRALVADAGINPYFATNGAVNPDAAGCVPINLFGTDNITQAAIDYTHRTLIDDFVYDQHVVAGNLRGELFEGFNGAGPVQAAVGIEYRTDKGDVSHGNPEAPYYSQFALSYQKAFAGKQETLEGYVELNAPIFRDSAIGKALEINAALRQSHTKSTDTVADDSRSFNITSWKVGAVYEPTEWMRLRATRSRDIRAAGFRELYIQQNPSIAGQFGGSVTNPFLTGSPTDATSVLGGGNVGLSPEQADTTTVGIVLQPTGALENLRFSADWYEIELNDAINSNPGAQTIVDQCFSFNAFCDLITFGANNDIQLVDNRAQNYSKITARGIDFEAAYLLDLDGFNNNFEGTVTIRGIAAYLYDFIVDTGFSQIDYAGQSGPLGAFTDWNPSPYWILNGWMTYNNGPFSLTVQGRYIGAGAYRRDRIGPQDAGYDPTLRNTINDNRVPSRFYLNVSANYAFQLSGDRELELFGAITNLLDSDPPAAPGGNGGATNPVFFDVVGAAFRAGMRVKF
ncbi:MAG: TonB-dependent receptor [Gammaproteobacteria bacterium]|nr:TonB-dependent receptor [Gammaproteobacteria bacterium]